MNDEIETDADFYRRREAQERAAAAASSCMVKDVHLDMAEAYAELVADDDAEGGVPAENDGGDEASRPS